MKKNTCLFIAGVVLVTIVLAACNRNKPELVVEKYYTLFYKSEFGEIQKYVLEEHRPFYELLRSLSENETSRKTEIKITDIQCEITGDTIAVCSCFIQEGDQEGKKEVLQLKKVDKVWLVNQGKEGNSLPYTNEIEEDANGMPDKELNLDDLTECE
jgi:hypothetical protein